MIAMKRLFLFALVNMAVLLTITIFLKVTGLDQMIMAKTGSSQLGMLIFCLIWGLGGSFISLLMSRWMAKRAYGIEPIDPQNCSAMEKRLVDRVYALARKGGMSTMPEVGIYASPELNAFATGASKDSSLVAVSTGLLEQMTDEEVEGVLAHEISHITNGDMVTLALIQGVVNAFVMFFAQIVAGAIDAAMRKDDQESSGPGMMHFVQVAFGFLGMIVVNFFSRWREFRADAGGADLAGRRAMANALRRLQTMKEVRDPEQSASFATMKISNFSGIFSTHPPLEERIARLEGRA
jgi:heat shock protein HtpX